MPVYRTQSCAFSASTTSPTDVLPVPELTFKNRMVTPDEQALHGKLAMQVPAGETVLGAPFTGA